MAYSRKPTLAGVLGYPVGHSKSPAIHNHWLRKYGIPGYYTPLEVAHADFGDVLRTLPKMGFRGVNITVPHKETALQYSDNISDQAVLIGAVNTLTFRPDGKLYGDNTDSFGFLEGIRRSVPGWSAGNGPALVFGAGGAARAVIYGLLSEGTPAVHIVNRTKERANLLRTEFGNKVKVADAPDVGDLLGQMNTVVNSSVLGMHGKPELKIPVEKQNPETVVIDLVYAPIETRFLRDSAAQGCKTVSGIEMLLYQAAAAFHLWFGIMPEVDSEVKDLVLGE